MPLHYVGIRVTDLRRSLAFYRRALGLRVAIRGDFRKMGRGIWVGLKDPKSGVMLELNWYPRGSEFATRFVPGESLDHIGVLLGAVGPKKLATEYDRLIRAGARPTGITPVTTHGWAAYVTDPDGNWIELFRKPTRAELRKERRPRRRHAPSSRT